MVELAVNKTRTAAGAPVSITVTLENTGPTTERYSVRPVLFGEVIRHRKVTIPAGQTKTVRFIVTIVAPGEHQLHVGSETVTIVVTDENPTPGTHASQGAGSGFTDLTALTALGVLGVWLLQHRAPRRE